MSTLMDHFAEIAEMLPYYRFRNLVETGIGTDLLRGGLAIAQLLELQAYSCDNIPERWTHARQVYPKAILGLMESVDFLRDVTPRIHGPTFFFLDAHLGTAGDLWPLYDELKTISTVRDCSYDVVWCDDVQHIADPANPACKGQRVGYTRADGTIWPGDTEHTLAEYIACLETTHDAVVDSTVLKFSPKRGE